MRQDLSQKLFLTIRIHLPTKNTPIARALGPQWQDACFAWVLSAKFSDFPDITPMPRFIFETECN